MIHNHTPLPSPHVYDADTLNAVTVEIKHIWNLYIEANRENANYIDAISVLTVIDTGSSGSGTVTGNACMFPNGAVNFWVRKKFRYIFIYLFDVPIFVFCLYKY